MNPYRNIPEFCFWSRSVTWPAPGLIDPVVNSRSISASEKIATIGSCFAQHLSKHIQRSGLDYYVAEAADKLTPEEAKRRNFGVFSARYGNVYTVRQALQLFERAFGLFHPLDDIWQKGGGYVDAFRPQIEPEPWKTPEEVRKSSDQHLAFVREVFTNCDWLVFTLGLTEAWCSKRDGAVYPVAPGVSGGNFDAEHYEFINFTAAEVTADLEKFIQQLRTVNPSIKILLTVSPVPLIATYEPRHVLVSNTYSKSALRVAADEVERKFDNVIYFPSYEIITSPAAGSRYYQDDLRQVTDLGISHVMRVFSEHFIAKPDAMRSEDALEPIELSPVKNDVVCDEEVIETALKISGF